MEVMSGAAMEFAAATMVSSSASCAKKLQTTNMNSEDLFKNKDACCYEDCQDFQKELLEAADNLPNCTVSARLQDQYVGLEEMYIKSWNGMCPDNEITNNISVRRRRRLADTVECTDDQIKKAKSVLEDPGNNANFQSCFEEVGVPVQVDGEVDPKMCSSAKCKEATQDIKTTMDSMPDCMMNLSLKESRGLGDFEEGWNKLCGTDTSCDNSNNPNSNTDTSASPAQRTNLLVLATVFSVIVVGTQF